jgi:hypothetical protein
MRKFLLCIVLTSFFLAGKAQMEIDGKLLYGNEWIDYNKAYLKLTVDQKGIYKVTYQDLIDAGISSGFQGAQLVMYNNGEEQALYTSSEDTWTESDYFLFYGQRNDGEIDKAHFRDWETEQLNPRYSLYSDERNYFLTLSDTGAQNLRYQEVGNNLSEPLPPQQNYYMHRDEKVFSDFNWSPSAPDVPDANYSSFIKTEGFGTRLSAQHSINFNIGQVFDQSGEDAFLEMRTGSNTQVEYNIHIQINGELIENDEYSGNQVIEYNIPFDTDLLEPTTELTVEGRAYADLTTIAYASLIYPRAFDALNRNNFEFEWDANVPERYFEIRKFNPGGKNFLFDIANKRYLIPELENGVAKFRTGTQGLSATRYFLVGANMGLKIPKAIELINFESLDAINAEYLIITSEKLNNNEGGSYPVQAYADFRSSANGGNYKTAVINVEDLYDQFSYGIKEHAISFRNFAQYINGRWPDFELAFLVGKALSYGNRNKNTGIESLVPTYGKPGSDILLFTEKGLTYPFVGVGRLAARTKEDVANYLDKAQGHAALAELNNRTVEERMWMKDVIHLSGGDPGIQQQLFNHLSSMKSIIENSAYGGNVTTYRKTSSDPVTTALSQQILQNINNGISMLTFFGHSSAGTFDFSVEDPDDYENTGKLPLILSMGCKSGDIHETVYSLSEDMILTKDKGAIAFVASSGAAFPTPLSVLGKDFYSKVCNEFYGKPVGLALRKLSEDLFDPQSTKVRTLHEQNTLHGDPAVVLFNTEAPDYVVDFASITSGGDVGATDEKIELSFDIVNLGRGVEVSLNNLIIHEYGDGSTDSLFFKTVAPFNRTNIQVELHNPGFSAIGKNVIEIILDVDGRISKQPAPTAESNNSLKAAYNNEGYCFFIFDNSAFPIYPREFAIINDPDTKLVASSTNALAEKAYYTLELDTTELFDSPFMVRAELYASPAFIEWDPNIIFENNTVYYWRDSPKSAEDVIWNTSSFIYLEDSSEGWNQSHLYQWQKDEYENYEYDGDKRRFRFAENLNEIHIENGAFPLHDIQMTVQNEPAGYLPYLSDGEIPSGVYISTFDGNTGLPWINEPGPDEGLYESELYTWWAQNFPNFPYRTDTPENRAKAIRFIEDILPDGNYVIL